MGYVYRGQFCDALAVEAHNKAFDFLKKASRQLVSQTTYRFELARTLYSQDINKNDDSDSQIHSSRTSRALDILRQIQVGDDDSEILLLQARCYRRLSEQLNSLPNKYDRESIRIMRQLVKRFPTIPQYQFELGYSLCGNNFAEIRDATAYFNRISEAIEIAAALVESKPNVPKYMQLAVLANEKHAAYYRSNNQSAKASKHTEAAIRLQSSLLKRFPQLVAQHRVFLFALRLESTNLMVEQMEYNRARMELVEITNSVEELVLNPKLENDWHALRVLTAAFDSLARVSDRMQRPANANDARIKADQYRKRLYKISS